MVIVAIIMMIATEVATVVTVRAPVVFAPFVVSVPPVMVAPVAAIPVVAVTILIADLQFYRWHKGNFSSLCRQRSHHQQRKREEYRFQHGLLLCSSCP
jgi:hypothetical protein